MFEVNNKDTGTSSVTFSKFILEGAGYILILTIYMTLCFRVPIFSDAIRKPKIDFSDTLLKVREDGQNFSFDWLSKGVFFNIPLELAEIQSDFRNLH